MLLNADLHLDEPHCSTKEVVLKKTSVLISCDFFPFMLSRELCFQFSRFICCSTLARTSLTFWPTKCDLENEWLTFWASVVSFGQPLYFHALYVKQIFLDYVSPQRTVYWNIFWKIKFLCYRIKFYPGVLCISNTRRFYRVRSMIARAQKYVEEEAKTFSAFIWVLSSTYSFLLI